MTKTLLQAFLHVLIIVPFTIFFLKERTIINLLRIFVFALCYVIYELVEVLPGLCSTFDIIKSNWNWDGKIYGIILGVIFYFLFRKLFRENDFFTLKQHKEGFKPALIGTIIMVFFSTIIWLIVGKSEFDLETLAFQISIPGIDEEIFFCGLLLGILTSALKERISFLKNPGVLLVAILFGLMHALKINKDNSIGFDSIYFLQTGFAGYVWGWITIKSRSILLAIFSHNFSNFFGALVTMIK
jgi:membrane protease YdiL (CAAX protease family)